MEKLSHVSSNLHSNFSVVKIPIPRMDNPVANSPNLFKCESELVNVERRS